MSWEDREDDVEQWYDPVDILRQRVDCHEETINQLRTSVVGWVFVSAILFGVNIAATIGIIVGLTGR